MSMIGHKMLSSLDNRLRAGTGKVDIPFGGMSVILMGDFGQLPPVGDRPMYVSGNGSVVSDHCHSLYLMFQSVIILDKVMQQAGDDLEAIAFRALLMRMRDGKVTEKTGSYCWSIQQQRNQWINSLTLSDCILTNRVWLNTIIQSC